MKEVVYSLMVFGLLFIGCKKDDDHKAAQPLTVKSFWPNSGNAGTIITISGTGFSNKADRNEVLFNGVAGKIMDARDSVLKVLAPPDGTTGMITLKTADQTKEVGQYTYQALSLSGMSPANGPAGTNIAIRGMGFSSMNGPAQVTVNGKKAVVTSSSDTLVVAAVPAAAGTGKVTVIVDGKEVTGPDFLFQNIASIRPLTGGKGTKVTIAGEGFNTDAGSNIVAFNGKPATVEAASATELTVTAPDEVATGPVTVTINGQQTVGSTFTVVPPPVIKTVAPLSGPVGAEITIRGDYYSSIAGEVKVTFNGIPATISSSTEKALVVKVPANAGTGKMNLTVNDQQTEGPEFKEQNLGVALLQPDNGIDGEEITITGIGFSVTATDNKVSFNGTPATVVSATETKLTVVVPQNVATGNVTVEVGGLSATGPLFGRAGVMTIAGGPGTTDLQNMNSIAIDSKGNLFVAIGNMVKKVTQEGNISIFAGSTASGLVDGVGPDARFNYIMGVAIDENDNLYVADNSNMRIRMITPAAVVTTAATLAFSAASISADRLGNIYIGQSYGGVNILNKTTGALTKVHTAMYESGDYIAAMDPTRVYYAPAYTDYLRIFGAVNGSKITLAGNGTYGMIDGPAAQASFRGITGLAVNEEEVVYVLDANVVLRSVANGVVTTITGTKGTTTPTTGYMDGGLRAALFGTTKNMCIDKAGNLYIVDQGNRAIRKVFFR